MADWNSGPDRLCPATSFTSTKLTEPVKIRFSYNNEELSPLKPKSVWGVFRDRFLQTPKKLALVAKRGNEDLSMTYEQYWSACHQAAKGFIKLGLEVGQCVCIIGFNAPEWMISLWGAIIAGGVGSGIYTTNSPEICEYIINDCGSPIIVVENNDQLKKILKIKDNTKVKAIIQYTGEVADSHGGLVLSWRQFIQQGVSISTDELRRRLRKIAPNKCATLIYTSGTTGNPKAVMLSHDNIFYSANFTEEIAGIHGDTRIVSFLPLSHIAAQLIDCFLAVHVGATVYFAQPDALKGSLATTLNEAKPTEFFGVPRVWEKMQEKMEQMAKSGAKVSPEQVKHLLGFGQSRILVSGGAPIKRKTLEFFKMFGIEIVEVMGLSESCGPHTVGVPGQNVIGSVGRCDSKLNRTKINQPDAEGNGELCMFGRHIFMGYLNSEQKTRETIDPEGWLLTGDLGRLDENKYLYITGRIKELIITSGGENISPVPIEDAIVAANPNLISNCMVIGDHKNYLTALVALKAKIDPNTTASLDELSDEAVAWLKSNGSTKTRLSEILAEGDPVVNNGIQAAIDKANEKAISNASKVQKFAILPRDFSIATGELGPTLKLRRPFVMKMHESIIEKMYSN